jgi:hypothetical protein
MTTPSLSGCIVQSLRMREMVELLPDALLSENRTQILHHDEGDYWDYKEELNLDNPIETARFVKDVLGFHNAKGGVLIVGVTDDYRVAGIAPSQTRDTYELQGKFRKFVHSQIPLFQDVIQLPNGKVLWLIFFFI